MEINKTRIVSMLLVPLLLFAAVFVGCNPANPDDKTTAVADPDTQTSPGNTGVLRLPYSTSETLHPFKAESMVNIQFAQLLYDSLFRLDKHFKPVPLIAKDYRFDGLKLTVTMKAGLRFSDGAALSADDVVYSFTQAVGSPAFGAKLSNFLSAAKEDALTVVFTLRTADPDAVNCLDFAVIRKDSRADLPTGSGRYVLTNEDSGPILRANPDRLGGFSPKIQTIQPINITHSESLGYTLQIGNIGFAFLDLSAGEYQRLNASAVEISLPNLVYLGLNAKTENLSDAAVRHAIHMLVDREAIAQTAFQGHATATYTPFHPLKTAGYDFVQPKDVQQAAEWLELAGFSKINDNGIRYSGWVNTLTFTLAVNGDNAFKTATAHQIAADLLKAGMKVTVRELGAADFLKAVETGSHDMYLGEIRLAPNMSLSPMLSPGGTAAYGIDTGGKAAVAYTEYLTGKADLEQFAESFREDTPFVPLCYRNGIAAFARTLKGSQTGSSEDIFAGIETWGF